VPKNKVTKPLDLFAEINQFVGKELKKTNEIIVAQGKGKADLIGDITQHLVLSGGKRVRPIITILGAKICGYKTGNRHCNLAAAVELIHTATLLHDDVVDGSDLRRGKKTANAVWGNKASILVGDYLLSVSFQLMVKDGSLEVLDILSGTSKIMADGEVMQLMNSNDITISEKKYLEIVSSKTAILFSAASTVGAVITNSDIKKKKALKDFGTNLGVAFQIMDDVLDYSANQKNLGKSIGDDFFEGKVTLPIILTYQKASTKDKERLKTIFADNLISDQKNEKLFAEIMDLMKKYDALENAKNKALEYENKAKKNLSIFPNNTERKLLIDILEYSVSRNN
jgi:octaprenyl-diphosphate synthase